MIVHQKRQTPINQKSKLKLGRCVINLWFAISVKLGSLPEKVLRTTKAAAVPSAERHAKSHCASEWVENRGPPQQAKTPPQDRRAQIGTRNRSHVVTGKYTEPEVKQS